MTGRDPIAWTPRPGGRSRPARDRPRAPRGASHRVGRCIAARTPRGSPTRPASRGGRERSSSANRDVGTRARAGGGDETRADGTHRAGDGGDVARPEGRARASAHVPLPRVATWTPVEATASGDLREASGRRRVCTSSRRCPSKTRLALANAVARSLAVTAFLREWLIFLLHQSRRVAAPSDNFHAALSNLEKPARRIASRSRSTNHLRSACAMNAPDVWVTDSLAPSAEITRKSNPTPAQYPSPRSSRAPPPSTSPSPARHSRTTRNSAGIPRSPAR